MGQAQKIKDLFKKVKTTKSKKDNAINLYKILTHKNDIKISTKENLDIVLNVAGVDIIVSDDLITCNGVEYHDDDILFINQDIDYIINKAKYDEIDNKIRNLSLSDIQTMIKEVVFDADSEVGQDVDLLVFINNFKFKKVLILGAGLSTHDSLGISFPILFDIAKNFPNTLISDINYSEQSIKKLSDLHNMIMRRNFHDVVKNKFTPIDITNLTQLEQIGNYDYFDLRMVLQHIDKPEMKLDILKLLYSKLNKGGVIGIQQPYSLTKKMEKYPIHIQTDKETQDIIDTFPNHRIFKEHKYDDGSGIIVSYIFKD